MPIQNGKNTPLNLSGIGGVPIMTGALANWLQPMTIGVVTKVTQAFQVVETMVEVKFRGVWQPLSERELVLKPEGQRSWSWYWLHCDPSLQLVNDDVVLYNNKQYRVMSSKNYTLYGYREYHLVTDWTGSGPEVAP